MAIDTSLPEDIRILQAAEEVFSQHGYEKATLDEIIALADVGKGTVYKYFGNNDAAVSRGFAFRSARAVSFICRPEI